MNKWGWSRGRMILMRKLKYLEGNCHLCHFIHHRYYMHWFGIKPRLPQWEAGNKLPEPRYGPHNTNSLGCKCQRRKGVGNKRWMEVGSNKLTGCSVSCNLSQRAVIEWRTVQLGEQEVADSDDEYTVVVRTVDTTRLGEMLRTLWSGSGRFVFFYSPLQCLGTLLWC